MLCRQFHQREIKLLLYQTGVAACEYGQAILMELMRD